MALQLLNISLSQTSANESNVTEAFLALIQLQDIKRTSVVSHIDWQVAEFTLGDVVFLAAYSEFQEAARILSVKFQGAKPCHLGNSSIDTVEGFFLAWAKECV